MRKFWLSPLATLRVGYAAFQQSLSESCRTVRQNLQPEARVHCVAEIAKALQNQHFADVAQLVEHFTRNEGVPGSSPGVGFAADLQGFGLRLG